MDEANEVVVEEQAVFSYLDQKAADFEELESARRWYETNKDQMTPELLEKVKDKIAESKAYVDRDQALREAREEMAGAERSKVLEEEDKKKLAEGAPELSSEDYRAFHGLDYKTMKITPQEHSESHVEGIETMSSAEIAAAGGLERMEESTG